MELISGRPEPHHGRGAYPRKGLAAILGTRARPGWGTNDLLYISQQARKNLRLRWGRNQRWLPQLLADADSPAKTATACDAIAKTVKTIIFFIGVLA
jgi:hypothetical protein